MNTSEKLDELFKIVKFNINKKYTEFWKTVVYIKCIRKYVSAEQGKKVEEMFTYLLPNTYDISKDGRPIAENIYGKSDLLTRWSGGEIDYNVKSNFGKNNYLLKRTEGVNNILIKIACLDLSTKIFNIIDQLKEINYEENFLSIFFDVSLRKGYIMITSLKEITCYKYGKFNPEFLEKIFVNKKNVSYYIWSKDLYNTALNWNRVYVFSIPEEELNQYIRNKSKYLKNIVEEAI